MIYFIIYLLPLFQTPPHSPEIYLSGYYDGEVESHEIIGKTIIDGDTLNILKTSRHYYRYLKIEK